MKRLVQYQLNFQSKFLTLSGVMMGFAFFLQALEFFALRSMQGVDIWTLLLFLILPMAFEALWCLPLRSECWSGAETHGIFAALISLMLLGQAILVGGVANIVMAAVFFVLSAAVSVLVTWGFGAHRALGMLVLFATALVRLLVYVLPVYVANPGYMTWVQQLPPVCMILAMMLFFGGLKPADSADNA